MRRLAAPVVDRELVAARVAAREQSEQFRALPKQVQEEYRARWQEEIERQGVREECQVARRWQSAVSGAALFVVVTLVFDVPTRLTLPAGAVIGAATGLVWELLHVGRFGALALAVPGYILLRAIGPGQSPYQMFFGAVAMVSFATLLGALREVETGGSDPRHFLPWRRRE